MPKPSATLLALAAGVLGAVAVGAGERPEARLDRAIAFYQERGGRPGDFYTPTLLAEAHLAKARATGDGRALADARSAAARALALRPDYLPALVTATAIAVAEHRFADAVASARRAIAADAAAADAHAALGDALLAVGDLAAARDAYETAHRRAPGLATLGRLAAWREAAGDADGAAVAWTEAIAAGERHGADPERRAWAHVQRGIHHLTHGRFDAAMRDHRAALALHPEREDAEARLAEALAASGDLASARTRYLRLGSRTARPELWQEIGDFLAFAGRPEEAAGWHDRAEAAYLRAAAAGDERYDHHLAGFYADARPRPAEALRWARKDLERRRSSAAWDALAWAHHRNGDHAAARTAVDHALAGPTDAHVLVRAALIYAAAGESARGADLLRAALASNPHFDRFHAHR